MTAKQTMVLAAGLVVAVVVSLLWLTSGTDIPSSPPHFTPTSSAQESKPDTKVSKATPIVPVKPLRGSSQKIDLSGAPGYSIIIGPDGTSYLKEPNGERKPLVTSKDPKTPPPLETALLKKIEEKLNKEPPPKIGQLVVLETGVVNIPPDAIVTYTGKDHLVAFIDDGTSATYYVDGRIQKRTSPANRKPKVNTPPEQPKEEPP